MLQDISNSCYFGGDALACMLDQIIAATGGDAMFGLILGAFIFGSMYLAGNGSIPTATVALILTGTVIMSMLPPTYQRIGTYVVTLGLAAAIFAVFQRYVMSGAAQ